MCTSGMPMVSLVLFPNDTGTHQTEQPTMSLTSLSNDSGHRHTEQKRLAKVNDLVFPPFFAKMWICSKTACLNHLGSASVAGTFSQTHAMCCDF